MDEKEDVDKVCSEGGGGGGGGGGGAAASKNFFSALRASFWSKNKGGARVPRAPPVEPPLYSS